MMQWLKALKNFYFKLKQRRNRVMTQEEKSLLLKDLSARLPYGVKGIITYNGDKDIFTIKGIFNILFLSDIECCHVEDFKPYLRSMDDMTEEEEKEICQSMKDYNLLPGPDRAGVFCGEIVEWLNSHYFDYRGLIEKGLAIEVTEENNPYKE